MFTLGIDIGSTTTKCIILKDGTDIVATSLASGGAGSTGPERAMEEVLKNAGLVQDDLEYIVATGYGRLSYISANAEISELTCHALGVKHLFPKARTIIDIGGQDAKVISLNETGCMKNFIMNDKCAAGTGRFLEVMAGVLQIDIDELGIRATNAVNPANISNTCTVFAESEVISQLASGTEINNIAAGICNSVASKAASLVKRIGVKDMVCMSGGVACNQGVRNAIARELGVEIFYSSDSQYMGALGAALTGYDKVIKKRRV